MNATPVEILNYIRQGDLDALRTIFSSDEGPQLMTKFNNSGMPTLVCYAAVHNRFEVLQLFDELKLDMKTGIIRCGYDAITAVLFTNPKIVKYLLRYLSNMPIFGHNQHAPSFPEYYRDAYELHRTINSGVCRECFCRHSKRDRFLDESIPKHMPHRVRYEIFIYIRYPYLMADQPKFDNLFY